MAVRPKLVLGIETSCDETAAAVVGLDRTILADRIASQTELHAPHGGVVPEIAASASSTRSRRRSGRGLSLIHI